MQRESQSWAVFGQIVYYACAESAILELSVKILTPPLDSAKLLSHVVYNNWKSVGMLCDLNL